MTFYRFNKNVVEIKGERSKFAFLHLVSRQIHHEPPELWIEKTEVNADFLSALWNGEIIDPYFFENKNRQHCYCQLVYAIGLFKTLNDFSPN